MNKTSWTSSATHKSCLLTPDEQKMLLGSVEDIETDETYMVSMDIEANDTSIASMDRDMYCHVCTTLLGMGTTVGVLLSFLDHCYFVQHLDEKEYSFYRALRHELNNATESATKLLHTVQF